MNEFHFKEPSLPPDKLLEAASNSLAEFQTKQTDRPTQNKPAIQNWRPPPKDTYKINYDNAFFSESDEAGIGAVVRNERGEVMASLAEKIIMPSGGVEEIFLITLVLVTLDKMVKLCFGHIVKHCKSIMVLLQTCSFSHVRRQSNRVAHILVRRVKKSFSLFVWMKSIQPNISFLVHVDVIP
ncbi:hypothetical protein ACB092_11G093900 [Castanea dentata]